MGNKVSSKEKKNKIENKQRDLNEITQSINKFIKTKKSPLKSPPTARIERSNMQSNLKSISLDAILDMAHQLSFNNLQNHQFHTNNSIYSTAILYSNTVKKMINKTTQSVISKKMTQNILNTSLFKDNHNITIRSNYETSISVCDENDDIHKRYRLKNSSHTFKKNSSCEDLNRYTKKRKVAKDKQNDVEMIIGPLDDKTSIAKEYKESIVIQEENENLFYDKLIRCTYPQNILRNNKIKSIKSLTKHDRIKNSLTYSRNIRNQIGYRLVNRGMYINDQPNDISSMLRERDRCQVLPHEKSLCYYLLENMCNLKGKDDLFHTEKIKKSDTKGKDAKGSQTSYKIDLKSLEKISTSVIKNKKRHNKNGNLNKKRSKHRRFISVLEHLMEIDPNNRSNIVKYQLNKQKGKDSYNTRVLMNELKTDTSSRQEEVDIPNYSNAKMDNSFYYIKEGKNHQIMSSAIISTEPTPKEKKRILLSSRK